MEKLYQAVELLLQTTAKSLRSTDLETAKELRSLAEEVRDECVASLTTLSEWGDSVIETKQQLLNIKQQLDNRPDERVDDQESNEKLDEELTPVDALKADGETTKTPEEDKKTSKK